jgi:hypothetical protein
MITRLPKQVLMYIVILRWSVKGRRATPTMRVFLILYGAWVSNLIHRYRLYELVSIAPSSLVLLKPIVCSSSHQLHLVLSLRIMKELPRKLVALHGLLSEN